MTESTEVVVIGGGYAGVMAANRLTQRDDVAVTLINPCPLFVERMRLHQLVGGSDDAVVEYREVLADRVRLVIDTVAQIEAAERSLMMASGGTVGYDYLIYAVGSGSAGASVPGVAEFAYPMASLEAAQRLRLVLNAAPATAAVTVVGAGLTGLEVAAELAEPGRNVTVVCGDVLGPYLHPRGRRAVARRMAKLGVTVLNGPGARVTSVTRDAVELSNGREMRSDVTIWTAGFAVPDLARRSGLNTDVAGRLLTDETLTSVDDARIVAAGDAAAPSDLPFRMSCYTAQPLGAHAADTVLSRIAGKQPARVSLGFFGACVGLGRRAAVAQFAHKNDVASGMYIGGRFAAMAIKELGTKAVVNRMAREARRPGSHKWRKGDGTRRELLEAGRGGGDGPEAK